eukprot:CAMPEP_0119573970 /NCGR_PEP_ID=MMETSP1352-20130426/45392_1 /TAXON_ID=265584 /ORGANISM="Stauroneis constricta, Strain CCMP1120" /LENGTH=121 /DNA_ID=CAMNT_0007623661 /DNA_START=53 /DNA_END=418 /DNA_ORIENTATION=+
MNDAAKPTISISVDQNASSSLTEQLEDRAGLPSFSRWHYAACTNINGNHQNQLPEQLCAIFHLPTIPQSYLVDGGFHVGQHAALVHNGIDLFVKEDWQPTIVVSQSIIESQQMLLLSHGFQ